ncbi:serine/arginine repetitive matrix protein 2 [Streptomyces sp. NPDC090022]|uniref:serine/arginine repetitive matrix protein 2 n=1 Tax=Streptomyces sp. NPDC090022 TaxID=3365920 RepID=UPI0037FD408D
MEEKTPDFAIDYGLLNKVQSKLRDMANQADSGSGSGSYRDMGEALASERRRVLGTYDMSAEFNYFYTTSKNRQGQAKDGLNKLADLFKGVSNAWFEADSQLAAGAGLMTRSLGLEEWKDRKKNYDKWLSDRATWEAYLKKIGASEYFRDHPDANIHTVCSADGAPGWCKAWRDDKDPPRPPGPQPPKPSDTPPLHYRQETSSGSIDVKLEVDKDNNIIKETSTVTAHGQTYTSTTEYKGAPEMVTPPGGGKPFDARDYTITTKGADGTTSVSSVVINTDGSGTMKVTEGDKVTEYTRAGATAPWVTVPKDEDEGSSGPTIGS